MTAQPQTLEEAMAHIDAIADRASALEDAGFESQEDFGRYIGLPPQVELLPDGRSIRLLTGLSYFRPNDGDEWPVPRGITADGASIPRAFWSLIGGPLSGKYRDPSIVHDHYCVVQNRPWRDTHRVFYEAMRCSDVAKLKAKIMYYAVHRFGPRWPEGGQMSLEEAMAATPEPSDADAQEIVADAETIAKHDPSLEEIEAMADAREQAGCSG